MSIQSKRLKANNNNNIEEDLLILNNRILIRTMILTIKGL